MIGFKLVSPDLEACLLTIALCIIIPDTLVQTCIWHQVTEESNVITTIKI